MKKILSILVLLSLFSVAIFAQEQEKTGNDKNRDESKWSNLSYVNVPILKVLEGKDGYVVLYQKNKTGVGSTVIPKKWARGTPDSPRKLKIRASKTVNAAFMTVAKRDGEFFRVILTVPTSKYSGLWGLVDYHKDLEGIDKDTLEELEL